MDQGFLSNWDVVILLTFHYFTPKPCWRLLLYVNSTVLCYRY